MRLRPRPEDAKVMREWFGGARATFNWALACIRDKPSEYKLNKIWLRKRFVNVCNIPKKKEYLLNTPKHIRDVAIEELVDAYATNFRKRAKDPTHKFDIKFRSRKEPKQCITLQPNAFRSWDVKNGKASLFPTFLENAVKFLTRKGRSDIPDKIEYDCKLTTDRLGRFFLHVTYHADEKVVSVQDGTAGESQASSATLGDAALDPGVRTAFTVYSSTPGMTFKLGNGDMSRIYRLCKHLDDLIGQVNSKRRNVCQLRSHAQRRRMRKAVWRLRDRIRHLVDEFHWKTIRFLLGRFRNIFIPSFGVSIMVKRSNRCIGSETARKMLCWRHYAFRQRLLDAASKTPGCTVHVCTEEWTSKTCTHCMNVKHDLGGAKLYNCRCCGLKADRDVVGARNIFIKSVRCEPSGLAPDFARYAREGNDPADLRMRNSNSLEALERHDNVHLRALKWKVEEE
jgi:putative transposase